MKRKTWIAVLAVMMILGAAGVVSAQTSDTLIGKQKAREIALQQAQGTVDDIDLERKQGKLVYEVEIEQSNRDDDDVEVKIDAATGQVLAVETDDDRTPSTKKAIQPAAPQSVADTVAQTQKATDTKPAVITKEQARQIAVDTVGGKVVEIERDRDDGILIYEVELRTSRGEVELDIDAISGKVLKIDYDDDDDDDDLDD